jgi:hypothetical protein
MKRKDLSSVQRRLLREQEELELDMGEEEEAPEKAPEEAEAPEEGEELELEPEEEGEAALDEIPVEDEVEEDEDKTKLLTTTIDSLEQIRSDLNKKGLLVAMQMSDFSTQRRMQSISDELGEIINHLNEKMLKTVAKSPMELQQATDWLAGGAPE